MTVSYSIGAKRGDVPWVVWFSGVPRLTPHDLRHTAASAAIVGHGPVLVRWDHGSYTLPIRVRVCLWLASGVSISTIQAWLGHSSLQTTQIYVHYLGDSADRAGLDVLNRRGAPGVRGPIHQTRIPLSLRQDSNPRHPHYK